MNLKTIISIDHTIKINDIIIQGIINMFRHKSANYSLYILFIFLVCLLSIVSVMFVVSIQKKIFVDNKIINENIKADQDVISLFAKDRQTYCNNAVMMPKVLYVIAEYKGVIGIFDSTQTELIELLNVDVDILPDTDRIYLANGIRIYSPAELLSVICDYTG